jgi:hypothetical protein
VLLPTRKVVVVFIAFSLPAPSVSLFGGEPCRVENCSVLVDFIAVNHPVVEPRAVSIRWKFVFPGDV